MTAAGKRYRMIALFAGGGGLHLGFHENGFETATATDVEPTSALTFAKNWPNVPFHLGDIRQLTPADIRKLAEARPIDLVIGGPPCQGFSTLGDQTHGDPRNSLFEAFVRVVRWSEAKCVLLENTSYLRSQYHGRFEREIRESLGALGYDVHVATLNAADFGAPQIRRRVFFFGSRLPAPFRWPDPTHGEGLLPYVTVGQAILDIADLSSIELPNHDALNHSAKVVARYRLIPEGGRLPPPQDLPPEIRRRNFGNTYKRLRRDSPSLTLVPGNNAFPVHPVKDRSLTPREAARLQGFPDSYAFAGTRAEQCKLVGNAVAVPLARALAKTVQEHLDAAGGVSARVPVTPAGTVRESVIPLMPSPRRRSSAGALTGVSLFTGVGGMLLGFARAGFDVAASFDRKSIVDRNLALNFPTLRHYKSDLSTLTSKELRERVGPRPPDVVFGGPPCEGFSIFGNRRFVRTRGHKPEDDPRNDLVLHFVRLAVSLEPKVILLENVKGLLSTARGERGSYLEAVVRRLKRAGYAVDCRVVNCADFGVPQLRQRLILLAARPGIDVQWPQQKFFAEPQAWQRRYVAVGDVIADLMDPSTEGEEFSHVPMRHKALLIERYKLIPEGGRLPEDKLPARLRKGYRSDNIRNYSHIYRRLAWDKPATTMVPGHNAFPIHSRLPRSLTVREAARIQTFPDTMRFTGTRQQQCMLVGNAVPPLIAELFAQAIAKGIRGNARTPGYKADIYELRAGSC